MFLKACNASHRSKAKCCEDRARRPAIENCPPYNRTHYDAKDKEKRNFAVKRMMKSKVYWIQT